MSNHAARREGDEYFCWKCGKRWATDDNQPSCIPLVRQPGQRLPPGPVVTRTEKKEGDIVI